MSGAPRHGTYYLPFTVEDPTAAVTHDPVDLKQSVDGWQNAANETSLKELEHTAADASDVAVTVNISGVTKGGKVTFTYTPASGSTSGSLAIAAATGTTP